MPRYYTRSKTRSQNRTTMHPTFAVPELRTAICADDVLTRGDLYNLCLVSRGFEAVAAPLLWENLDCLVPLLQLLSRDAWRMRPAEEIKDDSDDYFSFSFNGGKKSSMLLRRPLRPRDWTEAFVRYSKFVRTITLAPGEILSYEAQLRILDCPPPDAPVLPRLRTLMLKGAHTIASPVDAFVQLFTPPTVRTIVADSMHYWPMSDWQGFLARFTELSHFSMNIEHRDIFDTFGVLPTSRPIRFFDTFLAAIRSSKGLTSISLRFPYSVELLLALGSCPALQTLEWGLDRDDARPEYVAFSRPGFRSLKSFRCIFASLGLVRSVVAAAGTRRPMSVISAQRYMCQLDEFEKTTIALSDFCCPDALTEFTLQHPEGPAIVDKDALARLRCFPNMERVRIEGCRDVRLGEADWQEIAGWWPRMVSLAIDAHQARAAPYTLQVLAPLARMCPRLEYLQISLDASAVPSVDSEDVQARPPVISAERPHRVTLIIGDGPIKDSRMVANFLRALFRTGITIGRADRGGWCYMDGRTMQSTGQPLPDVIRPPQDKLWKQVNRIMEKC